MKKITEEMKREFINANINLVPNKSVEKFKTLTVDKQYTRMKEYKRKEKRKNSPKSRTINEILTDYLKSKNAKMDVVKRLMEKCNKWIDETKERECAEIHRQIAELQEKLNQYKTV